MFEWFDIRLALLGKNIDLLRVFVHPSGEPNTRIAQDFAEKRLVVSGVDVPLLFGLQPFLVLERMFPIVHLEDKERITGFRLLLIINELLGRFNGF